MIVVADLQKKGEGEKKATWAEERKHNRSQERKSLAIRRYDPEYYHTRMNPRFNFAGTIPKRPNKIMPTRGSAVVQRGHTLPVPGLVTMIQPFPSSIPKAATSMWQQQCGWTFFHRCTVPHHRGTPSE